MKKFMVLYMAKAADFEKMMSESTPEQQQKGMQGWIKWMGDNQKSLIDGGAPLGHRGDERVGEPLLVADGLRGVPAADLGVLAVARAFEAIRAYEARPWPEPPAA